ncbi:MAG: SGNH/GDSL hydrolase family protein [Lentisphaeria bacterium]|nr:SGNH/GDSL hydrolase family protein [Lentisphaeria bacterium]
MKSVDFKHPEFFSGITALAPAAQGVIPRRLSEAAIAFCAALEDTKGARARGGAGVRLRACSNTDRLKIKLQLHSRTAGDCIMTLADAAGNCEYRRFDRDTELNWELPRGNDRFTIFFPWQGELEVIDLQISPDADFRPIAENADETWLFIGDSITQGMEAEFPERSFVALLARKLGADFRNCGVGGLKMEPEFVRRALTGRFDAVLLAFGVNDASLKTPLPQFEKNVRSALETLNDCGKARIHVLTPLYWPGEDTPDILDQYRTALRRTAAAFPRVEVLEGGDLLPHEEKFFADDVHPNADGMAVIAENIWRKLNSTTRGRV